MLGIKRREVRGGGLERGAKCRDHTLEFLKFSNYTNSLRIGQKATNNAQFPLSKMIITAKTGVCQTYSTQRLFNV